jgi:hypothetical protein
LQLRKREGDWYYIAFFNAHQRPPPRTEYFDVPPLTLFVLTAGSTVENTTQNLKVVENTTRNIKRLKSEVAARWPERQADEHGFWNWKPRQYLQVSKSHERPLDQPLIADCSLGSSKRSMNACTVHFYWTYLTSVRYRFNFFDVPEPQWVELDRRVLELQRFLDARHPFPETK